MHGAKIKQKIGTAKQFEKKFIKGLQEGINIVF